MYVNLNKTLTDLVDKGNEIELGIVIRGLFKLAKENFLSLECKETLFKFIKNKADSEILHAGIVELPESLYTYLAYKMFKEGICVEKNPAEAKKYLLKMVEHHKYYACKELLLAYRYGNAELDIAPDKEAMIEWCFKIADYKSPTYLYFLALQAVGKEVPEFYNLGIGKDLQLAVKCLIKLNTDVNVFFGIRDELNAIFTYIAIYRVFAGYHNIPDEIEYEVYDVLEKDFWDCASYNNINYSSTHLINLLGTLYYEMGDYEKAAESFERASCYGSLGGRLHLSDMYSDGIGVPQDKEIASKIKKEIADLFEFNQLGDIWDLAYDEEYKLLETVEYVAESYRNGIGVEKSLDDAYKYFSIIRDNFHAMNLPENFEEAIVQRASKAIEEMGYQ